jgi:putative peptidoglycan lipid II flippase
VSSLSSTDRLNQLPLGVVGIAVGTAILPPLSRQVRTGDLAGAAATQNRGVELAVLLTLPAAAALMVLAEPILAVLFERGAFGAAATAATAAALAAYAAGLPAFVLVKVLAPAFFAHRDTATPVKVAVGSMAVNLALTLLLMRFFAHVGVAVALSCAGWMQALVLMFLLARSGRFQLDRRTAGKIPRIAAATAGMAAVLIALRILLAPTLAGPAMLRFAALAGLIAAGLVSFAILILAVGVTGWRELRGQLRRQPA